MRCQPSEGKGVFIVRVAACVWSCRGLEGDATPGFSMFADITLDCSTFNLTL